jgi:putative peptide zinc metalloprotease protein
VKAGDILVRLESLELQAEVARARSHERLLNWELEQQPFDPDLQQDGSALRERWTEALAAVRGLEEQAEQLTVRAPFDGRAAEVDESLVPGAWIAAKEKLFEIIGPLGAKAEAFVDESALPQLQVGSSATFVADTAGTPSVACRVNTIDRVNLSALDTLYLASAYGGAIPVQKDKQGMLVPTEGIYRVHLEKCAGPVPARELRGVMHLQAGSSSITGSYLRRAIAVLQREMGL